MRGRGGLGGDSEAQTLKPRSLELEAGEEP